RYTELPGLRLHLPREYITAPEYRAYLDRYAAHHRLAARQVEVTAVLSHNRAFQVDLKGEDGSRTYQAVVVATGMYDFPIYPDIPGLPGSGVTVLHARDWPGPEAFQGRRLLIVGGATG